MSWAELFADPGDRDRIEWGLRSFSFAAAPPVTGLISGARIDDWLRYGRVRYPQFQLTSPSGAVPSSSFTQNRPYRTEMMPGFPDVAAIAAQLALGATLHLVHVEDVDKGCAQLCARLTTALNAAVTVDACYAPRGDDGLGAGFAAADVFAVQAEGSRIWQVWDIPDGPDWRADPPLPGDAAPDHVLELAPGEGLYLPAGLRYRTSAGPSGSLHLSVTVTPASLHEVVRAWTQEFLATVPALETLPLFGDRLAAITDLLRGIALAADKTDPAELLAQADRHRPALSTAPLIPGVRPPDDDPAC